LSGINAVALALALRVVALLTSLVIGTELVSSAISGLHGVRAPDIVGLTSEHLAYNHPSLSVVLCKLLKLIVQCRHVPDGFRHS